MLIRRLIVFFALLLVGSNGLVLAAQGPEEMERRILTNDGANNANAEHLSMDISEEFGAGLKIQNGIKWFIFKLSGFSKEVEWNALGIC